VAGRIREGRGASDLTGNVEGSGWFKKRGQRILIEKDHDVVKGG